MSRPVSAFVVAVIVAVLGAIPVPARAQTTGERFGIGMFKVQNRTFVGLAMRYPTEPQQIGGVVVELPAAAQAANQTGIPGDVMLIVQQWEVVGPKIKQIVAHVGPMIDKSRPAYVHDYKSVDALAPFVPRLAAYGFGNYRAVLNTPEPVKPRPPAPSIPGIWERSPNDDRPVNPRIFLIPNTPEVFIGDGEPVINWHADKRNQYQYECELLGVVGKSMRRVPVDQVKNHMFGYLNTNDISDRQGRDARRLGRRSFLQQRQGQLEADRPVHRAGRVRGPVEHAVEDDRWRRAGAGLAHQSGLAQHVRVRRLSLEPDHGAGGDGDRDGHAARITWGARPLHGGRRHADLLVRGAGHPEQSAQDRGEAPTATDERAIGQERTFQEGRRGARPQLVTGYTGTEERALLRTHDKT